MSERRGNNEGFAAGDDRAAHGERWNAELAAYALDALESPEREALEAHLAGCDACSERLRWMLPAVDVLPATVAPQSPPPALKSRIMDVVGRESAMIDSAADPGRAARGGVPQPARRRILGGLSLRPVLVGLGVFLLLAAAITGYALRDGGAGAQPEEVFTANAERPASPASGELEVSGDAGMLHVTNLPPTGADEVYQAWVQDSGAVGGTVHPSSVFVVSEDGVGDVAIPHGLSHARRVMVTREPKGGSQHPSENSLLTAVMD